MFIFLSLCNYIRIGCCVAVNLCLGPIQYTLLQTFVDFLHVNWGVGLNALVGRHWGLPGETTHQPAVDWVWTDAALAGPEANIIKKKDKLLGRFIPYFTCKIWNKNTQYVVLKKHDILGILRKIWTYT